MKIYVVARREGLPPAASALWDGSGVQNGVVVRAASNTRAREIAANFAGAEGDHVWFDQHYTSCDGYEPADAASAADAEGLVLRDFTGDDAGRAQ